MFLQNRASARETPGPGRRRWPVAPNSHPVNRRPFVGRSSVSASRSPPRRSASSMSRFWSSPVSSRGCPGTAPLCAARCRPPASLVKVVLARVGRPSRAALPVAGAKADAGWNGFLWSAGLGGSASRTRSTQQCSPRLFTRAEEHTQRFRLGFCDFTHSAGFACCLLEASLTQECVQRSLLALSGYVATTGI